MPEQKTIDIVGARLHNLKNINVSILRNKMSVVTGVSGSGKSSLIFDTLYAEGQRRYVESLSSYARQFLGRMEKPEVDHIHGLSPSIAIEQKVLTRNPRSTVATSTELYDYLKLLFARAGHTISPVSGSEVKRHQVSDVVRFIRTIDSGRVLILAPFRNKDFLQKAELALQKGFTRMFSNGKMLKIEAILDSGDIHEEAYLIVDRLSLPESEEHESRWADSIQTAFWEGQGEMIVAQLTEKKTKMETFSNKFELDGMEFELPTVNLLSFNNPYGACKTCEGFGAVLGIDEDLVIPDKGKSLYEGAVAPWRGETFSFYLKEFIHAFGDEVPVHRPYFELADAHKDLLWEGKGEIAGIHTFFKHIQEKSYKIQYRVLLAKFRGKTICNECKGTRLRKEANYIRLLAKEPIPDMDEKAQNMDLSRVLLMSVNQAHHYFSHLYLEDQDQKIAKRVLNEIVSRLTYLKEVGLGYLSLNRQSNTLSGGESQRINLSTSLGSTLVGSTYILDEPSIGLHPKDTGRLVGVLKRLRDIGNTVVVVEHEEDVIKAADEIIDIGPEAGSLGGELVFQGSLKEMYEANTLTSGYFNGSLRIPVPERRRKVVNRLELKGVRHHNLKNVDVMIPLSNIMAVTGVSGSGKTSLVKGVLYPALMRHFNKPIQAKTGEYGSLTGDLEAISDVELIDQNPIGRSSRSNPVSYLKAYDLIRDLFSKQPLSKQRGYKPGVFSFNVPGGRCDLCEGEGEEIVEMQFMADLHIRCESCGGKRFKDEILEVNYREKSIHDVLQMTVDQAVDFFADQEKLSDKLKALQDVGLGYVQLGQSSNTLSGGEAQRVKLAFFLTKGKSAGSTLFIFDEPTTGLHFHDINKLMKAFNSLVELGHSVLVIEHNLDVIKCADYMIDLGPEGGSLGGYLLAQGTPENVAATAESVTGQYLVGKL